MESAKPLRPAVFLAPGVAVTGSVIALATAAPSTPAAWLGLGVASIASLALGARYALRSHEALETARRSEASATAFARGMIDRGVDPVVLVSHEGAVTRANQAAAALFGRTREELAGTAFAEHFVDGEAALTALDRVRSRGSAREVALALRRGDAVRDLLASASLLDAVGDAPREALVTLRDATDARRGEAVALRKAAEARSLIEGSTEPLLAVNAEGKLIDVNGATMQKTGATREQLLGSTFSALFADPEPARRAHERTLSEGRVTDVPLVLVHRDGTRTHVLFSSSVHRGEDGTLLGAVGTMRDVTLARKAEAERDAKDWIVTGIGRLNTVFQEQSATSDFARRIISELAEYTGAQVGAFYTQELEGDGRALTLLASHAYTRRKGIPTRFLPGEGLIGQAALERKQILVSDLPDDYVCVGSGLGESPPRHLCVTPLVFEGTVRGMIELASLGRLSDTALDYLRQAAVIVAVALEASMARERVSAALARAQQLAAELEAQQETLRNTNAELEEQTAALKISEQKLKSQQAEIELANTELQQKNELLERQRNETEEARRTLAAQAEEVALASKYKSEFLANMSHELRTPLNSLLLLARSLRDNGPGNLDDEQIESARVIYESGSDLLNLINEILDLSKIEAGKMELRLGEVDLADVARALVSQFDHMARAQGLSFEVSVDASAPATVVSDAQRLGQILKNLIGNAIKFTERGGVTVTFARPTAGARLARSGLDPARALAVHVRDTGIGIPADKQRIIFEAFQQADSGDRRRFGGTGLGLSISRELANLLGGEIQLVSEPGRGSTFTIFLPEALGPSEGRVAGPRASAATFSARGGEAVSVGSARVAPASSPPPARPASARPTPASEARASSPEPERARSPLEDDRDALEEHDRVVLVIEDDLRFSKALLGHVRQRGFKCLHAATGEEGLELAREHRPHGVVLDIELPGMDGWAVLTALKQDVSLRHIPVHIVSAEPASTTNLGIGAIGYAPKPIAREQIDEVLRRLESASAHADKRVLVVEDDPLMRQETARVIGNGNVKVHAVGTAREAIESLRVGGYALVVMDLGLPDMQGVEMLELLAKEQVTMPPVIVHTVRDLTMEEEIFLRNYSDSIIIKDVRSQERLIDEVALFLHRVVRELPEDKRRAILHLRESDEPLRGKKVLIVEDDMRTMFAMARLLAAHGIHPLKAENGERALALLDEQPDTDLVLLDMMMPVMDGYETARRLRLQPRFTRLPVIALTAKAMREDRQKCIDAGCTDYLSKPVDPDRLASLMRVLLFR
jgi:PAS domain S-box-containing protein